MKAIHHLLTCLLTVLTILNCEIGLASDPNDSIEPSLVKQNVNGADLRVNNIDEAMPIEIVPQGKLLLSVPKEIQKKIARITGTKSELGNDVIDIGAFTIDDLHLEVLATDKSSTANGLSQGHKIQHVPIHKQIAGDVAFFSSKLTVKHWNGPVASLDVKQYYLKIDVIVTKIGEFKRHNGVIDDQFSATAIWHGPIVVKTAD